MAGKSKHDVQETIPAPKGCTLLQLGRLTRVFAKSAMSYTWYVTSHLSVPGTIFWKSCVLRSRRKCHASNKIKNPALYKRDATGRAKTGMR